MEHRTGTFRLILDVQWTDRVVGLEAIDLLPLEERISNEFQVLPPE